MISTEQQEALSPNRTLYKNIPQILFVCKERLYIHTCMHTYIHIGDKIYNNITMLILQILLNMFILQILVDTS